uniref:Uncharacterized protein n=1 Tax=Magallana gigas TaxID=29159 RepID=K1QCE6_MAGGI
MYGGTGLRSNSAVFDGEIPTQTSNWNCTVFPKLHIESIPDVFSPYVVFSSYADFLENQKIKRSKIIATMNEHVSEKWELQDCYTYAIEHILDLDYEHIDHVPVHRVKELHKYTQSQALDEPLLEEWQKMHEKISDFLWQLLYLVNKRQIPEPEELTEGMFQDLFIRFARIFGLNLIKESDSQTQRNLERGTTVHNQDQCVDSRLKGQLVGDILAVLKNSMFGPTGIFGLIVQATEVTIVAFATENNYLECIKNGKFPNRDCATVKYSEKCNILAKRGRLELVKAFLGMADLMECL